MWRHRSVVVGLVLVASFAAGGCAARSDAGDTGAGDGTTSVPGTGAAASRPTVTMERQAAATTMPAATSLPAGDDASVAAVVDGDTLALSDGTRVRLIGVDTPETRDPRRPIGCFGAEASAHTSRLVPPGTAVRLVYDVERTDRFGRTLAYVYRLGDGLFVNASLVREGFAVAYTVPPNVRHAHEFLALEREARDGGRGLWSACGDEPPPSEPPAAPAPPAPAPEAVAGSSCDPSYPDACIPPPPPDLDCPDVPHRRFRVVPPDPHRFDADGDGIGCESG